MSSILQWNCRGLRTSIADLQVVLCHHRPLVVCLQETKLLPESSCAIKGYSVFRKDLNSDTVAHGGVLLAVHNSVPARYVPLRTGLQAVASSVQLGQNRFTVCTVYLPPGVALPVVEMRELVAELPEPVLLLGDFNAHHTLWGCRCTDSRGRLLEAFVRDEGLCLLNTGRRTHVTLPSGQTSALDLSVSSPQLVPLLSWEVDEDPMGSDHFPIWMQFQSSAVLGQRPPRWNLMKADWNRFQEQLDETFSSESEAPSSVEDFTFRL